MKIIGHRGAAGLALENSLESITEGIEAGANFIEIDVRLTRDKKLILNHDDSLKRTYGVDLKIADHTLKQLRIPCPTLPTLEQALKSITCEGVIIELKDHISPGLLFKATEPHQGRLDIRFASFHHGAIREIKKSRPDAYCYVLEHHSPFEIVNHAGKMKADGIGLHYAILNPLTLILAKLKKLDVYVYWLNKEWVARAYKIIYGKHIDICTDYPNVMVKYQNRDEGSPRVHPKSSQRH